LVPPALSVAASCSSEQVGVWAVVRWRPCRQ